MAANLEIYDTTLTTVLDSFQSLGDLENGNTSGLISIKIQNDGSTSATNIRLFARCINGLYTGQTDSGGQEAITEQWIQVQESNGGYQAIGGDFAGGSNPSAAGNYFAVSDIAASGASGQIDFKVVIPSSSDTAGEFILQIGVSYKP